jgi:hypothetical protein
MRRVTAAQARPALVLPAQLHDDPEPETRVSWIVALPPAQLGLSSEEVKGEPEVHAPCARMPKLKVEPPPVDYKGRRGRRCAGGAAH